MSSNGPLTFFFSISLSEECIYSGFMSLGRNTFFLVSQQGYKAEAEGNRGGLDEGQSKA